MSKCQYYDQCPSATGWCANKGPSAERVPFLFAAIEEKIKNIMYVCDQRACERCSYPDSCCGYTRNIRHAKNFHLFASIFVED